MISNLNERSHLRLKRLTMAIKPISPTENNPIYRSINDAIPEKKSPASQGILPLVSMHLYSEILIHSRKRMKGPSDHVNENTKRIELTKNIKPAQCTFSLKIYRKSINIIPIIKRFKALDAHNTPKPVSFDIIKIMTGYPIGHIAKNECPSGEV
jgi:hypothetical protein